VPALLEAAADAGATSANYVPLRLPHQLGPLFEDWLERHYPDRKAISAEVRARIGAAMDGGGNAARYV
jgi:DNA repair photolyase